MWHLGGGYNELDFLVHVKPVLTNRDNTTSVFNETTNIIFKRNDAKNTKSVKNYYKETVYKSSGDGQNENLNPYLKLIRDFEDPAFRGMIFRPADFTYLTDLGVYPTNRLWVLRRFNEGVVVPDNLQLTKQVPISTVVGWVKPEDESFFSMSFNEEWTTINERVDQVLTKILEKEFGFKAASAISLPGWSQGLLFGFLNEMGLTDFDYTNIPMGDPAVLQEAATRAKDANPGYGNKSNMSLTLTTSYEQKFIGSIDPGNAMLDIVNNLLRMGTRNTKFVFGGDGENSPILKSLRNAAKLGNDVDAWWEFIMEIIKAFTTAIGNIAADIKKQFSEYETPQPKAPGKGEKVPPKGSETVGALEKSLGKFGEAIGNSILLKSVLASTVAKWRYALIGSIALMDGSNSTPWHLTMGNPYSPFVSFGNIVVKSINLKFNNEFSFNDIPTKLDVEIQVQLGRNIGAQEIFQMFNKGYQRTYTTNNKPWQVK